MTIQVTREHIDAGRPNDGGSCPVALATKAATGGHVFVGRARITLGPDHRKKYEMDDVLRAFVDAFDAGKPVEPFELELPL